MKLKLAEKKNVTDSVKTFIFETPEPLKWQAGQYLHYVLDHPNPDDRGDERWFTISNPPYAGRPSITTRFTPEKGSSFKAALDKLQIGDEIEADTVEGDFVLADPKKPSIFIAGGIGVTPFHSMLLQMYNDKVPIKVDLMYASRDSNIVFGDELQTIAQANPEFRIHEFVDPKKIEEADIKAVAEKLDDPDYYVSGPYPMVDAYAKLLKQMGVAEAKIHMDDFPGYENI